MATPPDFSVGQVLTAANMNAVGLWLVKTVTVGTGVSTVSVTSAFSADYDAYRITYSGGTGGATTIRLSLTGSGSNNYYAGYTTCSYAGAAGNLSDNNSSAWNFAGGSRAGGAFLSVDLFNPFAALRTGFAINGRVDADTGGGMVVGSGFHNLANSYSGFTLGVDQPITGGTIRVYGYRK